MLGVAWVCFVTQIHVNLTAPRQEGVPGESFLCPYISKQCVPIRFEIATLLSMTYTLYVCVCVCDVLHILPTYQGKKVYQVSPSLPCSGGASGASSWPLATTKRSVGRVCAHCVINVCWIGLGT